MTNMHGVIFSTNAMDYIVLRNNKNSQQRLEMFTHFKRPTVTQVPNLYMFSSTTYNYTSIPLVCTFEVACHTVTILTYDYIEYV